MEGMRSGQAAYRAWAKGREIPVLHTPAWLDVAAPTAWEAIVVGEVAWPFVRTRRWGIATVHDPPLSHRLGPWPPGVALAPLLQALPPYGRLSVGFHPARAMGTDAGVTEAPSYVCLPEAGQSEEALLASYHKSWRKHVRHGLKLPVVENTLPPGGAALFDAVLEAGGTQKLPEGLLSRIQQALVDGKVQGKLLVALVSDQPIAAALVVWDAQRTYYLANGRLPSAPQGAVHALTHQLLWESLRAGRAFDFMGSRLPGVANFNQGFGAAPEPYGRLERVRHPLLRLKRFLAG